MFYTFNKIFFLITLFFSILGTIEGCRERNQDTGARLLPPGELTAAAGDQQITLTWRASISYNEADYNIYQSTGAEGPFNKVLTVKSTSAAVMNLKNGTIYYFKLTASLNNTAESVYSNTVKAVPGE